jgi:two-component system response regulator AtoC
MTFTDIEAELIRAPLHENLLGVSPAIRELGEVVERLAKSDLTVLITGESGTGKDVCARMLHKMSPRYGKPFIKVNCPAIPESILESELFGYERGAFTGARSSKPGRFELANNGTIFLDEIAETSYSVQSKLLQVLEGDPFMRIGGTTPVKADVRIIAATNVSLEDAVKSGRMRQDIYYRLSEVIVEMPPLRDRPEDIPLLAEHFNFNFTRKLGKDYEPISPELLGQIQELPWVGNVRELGARVKKFVATRKEAALLDDDGPSSGGRAEGSVFQRVVAAPVQPQSAPSPVSSTVAHSASRDVSDGAVTAGPVKRKFMPLKEATRRAVESTERALIEEALRTTLWNRRKAAKLLDISYSSLLRRIEAYSIGKSDTE